MTASQHTLVTLSPDDLPEHLNVAHGIPASDNHGENTNMHQADHAVANRRNAPLYEHARIGGGKGITLSRCTTCRCLIENTMTEQNGHTEWHEKIGKEETTGW